MPAANHVGREIPQNHKALFVTWALPNSNSFIIVSSVDLLTTQDSQDGMETHGYGRPGWRWSLG
jgi:hypothetical protein